MMKTTLKIAAIVAVAAATFVIASKAQAQVFNNYWKLLSGTVQPVVSSYDFKIPSLGGGGTLCVQVDNDGLFSAAANPCGTGGGGGGTDGNWVYFNGSGIRLATTSNQVAIGATATTSLAKLSVFQNGTNPAAYFLGNVGIGTTSPYAPLSVVGQIVGGYFTATTTTASTFPLANITKLSNLTGNGIVTTSGGDGTLSIDTTTYLSTIGSGTAGQLSYWSAANTLAGVATTTVTASSPLSFSQPVVKVGGSNSTLTLDTSGTWSGNAGTATALAGNGSNCSAGSYPLGVNASGAAEDCTDATTEINSAISTHAGDAEAHQDLVTLAGTPDYITLSGQVITRNAIDLATDVTGDLPFANLTQVSANSVLGNITGSTADVASLATSSLFVWNGTGNVLRTTSPAITTPTLTSFFGTPCTGNEFLQDIGDTGTFSCAEAAGGSGTFSWTPTTNYGATANATTTPIWFQNGLQASTTSHFVNASTTALTADTITVQDILIPTGGYTNIGDPTFADNYIYIDANATLGFHNDAGTFYFENAASTAAYWDVNALTSNRTVYFPNLSGSPALGSYTTGFLDGHVPFGSSGLLATSSALVFDSSLSKLTVTNSSTTLASFSYASSTVWRGGGLTTDCDADTQALGWDITTGQFTCGDDDNSGGGGGSFPFSVDSNYGQVVYSTSTPTLWLKSGLMASSTSYLVNASTTDVTVAEDLDVNNGRIVSDSATGTTTISQLQTGRMEAEPDSGIIGLFNFPVVGAANSTEQSFSFGFNDNASTSIKVRGTSNGSGNVTNFGLQVATSTQFDTRDVLTVGGTLSGNATTTITLEAKCYNIRNSSGTWISFYYIGTTQVVENNPCR